MAKEKKPVHKVQMTEGKRQIIQQLLQEYDYGNSDRIVWILYGQKGKGTKKIALQISEGPTANQADNLLEIIDYIYSPVNVLESGSEVETKDSEFYTNVYKSRGKNTQKYAYGQMGRQNSYRKRKSRTKSKKQR